MSFKIDGLFSIPKYKKYINGGKTSYNVSFCTPIHPFAFLSSLLFDCMYRRLYARIVYKYCELYMYCVFMIVS